MVAALDRHLALIGFMGAGKSTVGAEVAKRLARPFWDVDWSIEQHESATIPEIFERHGEATFRQLEERVTLQALHQRRPSVIALGGGGITSERTRSALARHGLTVLLDVDLETAWERAHGSNRPLARDKARFAKLYEERRSLYAECADAVGRDADDAVLAAGGVRVETGSLERLGELVPGEVPVALVSDRHVAAIHGAVAQIALGRRLVSTHELPPGEDAKTTSVCEQLWRELRLDRNGVLVALGGGATTDAAGFVAATYLRGIDWVSVPTTLVGQVDAGIGGKTAINLPEGKNLVGSFHWPVGTVIDPGLLTTLPQDEYRSGMAEVVKTGLLAGEQFWELPAPELVRRCAAFKTAICLQDPDERGRRAVLNLGHTFAHALEAAAEREAVSHGEAVGLGLLASLRLSARMPGGGDDKAVQVVERVLRPRPVRADRERAWDALRRDKKASGGRIRLVLLESPGNPVYNVELAEEDVRRALDELIAD